MPARAKPPHRRDGPMPETDAEFRALLAPQPGISSTHRPPPDTGISAYRWESLARSSTAIEAIVGSNVVVGVAV